VLAVAKARTLTLIKFISSPRADSQTRSSCSTVSSSSHATPFFTSDLLFALSGRQGLLSSSCRHIVIMEIGFKSSTNENPDEIQILERARAYIDGPLRRCGVAYSPLALLSIENIADEKIDFARLVNIGRMRRYV